MTSRPIHGRLAPVPEVRLHVFVAEGPGLPALAEALAPVPAIIGRSRVLFTPGSEPRDTHALALETFPKRLALLGAMADILATASMSSRLYIAGEESFIAEVEAAALACGLQADAIQSEHRGTRARRVQCVHCKTFMDDVTASPVRCTCCGTHLLVRDHYSRRLGAFMGVSIDAEAPGDVPQAEPLPPVASTCKPELHS